MTWVPAQCTLPSVERASRVAELDELFVTALRGVARPEPTLLRLTLDGADSVAKVTRDPVAREASCCSLFDLTLTSTPDRALQLEVRVSADHAGVLDELVARAADAAAGRLA